MVTLTAAAGIGGLATIEINTIVTVNRGLTATVTGTGAVNLSDVNELRVRNVVTADGNITLNSANGVMIVETITAGGATGAVNLSSPSNAITDGNAAVTNITAVSLSAASRDGNRLGHQRCSRDSDDERRREYSD